MTRINDDNAYKAVEELHKHWLDEPEQKVYPYRVRVVVTTEYDVDVDAENEEQAYEEASAMVYSEEFPHNADLYDENVEFISCEEL